MADVVKRSILSRGRVRQFPYGRRSLKPLEAHCVDDVLICSALSSGVGRVSLIVHASLATASVSGDCYYYITIPRSSHHNSTLFTSSSLSLFQRSILARRTLKVVAWRQGVPTLHS